MDIKKFYEVEENCINAVIQNNGQYSRMKKENENIIRFEYDGLEGEIIVIRLNLIKKSYVISDGLKYEWIRLQDTLYHEIVNEEW